MTAFFIVWLVGAMVGWFYCAYKDIQAPAPFLITIWPIVLVAIPLWGPWWFGSWLRERERNKALQLYLRERELERLDHEVAELLR